MIHLFRNLSKDFTDVIFPKKYLYKLAFELYGLKNEFSFHISGNYIKNEEWWDNLINQSNIGFELRQLNDSQWIEKISTTTQGKFQNLISNYWFRTVTKNIENNSDVKIISQRK